jgi:hypothetical protein
MPHETKLNTRNKFTILRSAKKTETFFTLLLHEGVTTTTQIHCPPPPSSAFKGPWSANTTIPYYNSNIKRIAIYW